MAATEAWQAVVEVSTVNRKQAEVVINLPREIAELESPLRQAVLSVVTRGRVQMTVRLEAACHDASEIQLDRPLALALESAYRELSTLLGRPLIPGSSEFLRMPGVFSASARVVSADEAWRAISPALEEALTGMRMMREEEGAHLRADILSRLEEVEEITAKIAGLVPGRAARQRDALERRLREAQIIVDFQDERFLRELALFADRCDISEEWSRLHSHLKKFRALLDEDASPGRALDFLCQELFRECNTMGAKANDSDMAHLVVEAKTALEKIREQVQNVE